MTAAGRARALSVAAVVTASMTVAVMMTANHFVLDVLSGIILCLAGGFCADRLHSSSKAHPASGWTGNSPRTNQDDVPFFPRWVGWRSIWPR
jgi:PAP2 superfamily